MAAIFVLIAGLLAGRAIGGDSTPVGDEPLPAPISTQDVSIEVPTLGSAERLPTFEVPPPTPATEMEKGASSDFTPEEVEAPEVEAPAPEPEASPPPEVTVAPSD
jgi:hypothetical protein